MAVYFLYFKNPILTNITMEYFLPRDDDHVIFSKCLMYNRTYEDFMAFWNSTDFQASSKLDLHDAKTYETLLFTAVITFQQ